MQTFELAAWIPVSKILIQQSAPRCAPLLEPFCYQSLRRASSRAFAIALPGLHFTECLWRAPLVRWQFGREFKKVETATTCLAWMQGEVRTWFWKSLRDKMRLKEGRDSDIFLRRFPVFSTGGDWNSGLLTHVLLSQTVFNPALL